MRAADAVLVVLSRMPARTMSDRAFALLTKDEVYNALDKHRAGDWGMVCPEDWHENDEGLNNRGLVRSEYKSGEGRHFG